MASREVRGVAIDATVQPISEAPFWAGDGETVAATPDADGEERVEGVPDVVEGPDEPGQSTLDDWGRSR